MPNGRVIMVQIRDESKAWDFFEEMSDRVGVGLDRVIIIRADDSNTVEAIIGFRDLTQKRPESDR